MEAHDGGRHAEIVRPLTSRREAPAPRPRRTKKETKKQ
jgi:hypothetical protein